MFSKHYRLLDFTTWELKIIEMAPPLDYTMNLVNFNFQQHAMRENAINGLNVFIPG